MTLNTYIQIVLRGSIIACFIGSSATRSSTGCGTTLFLVGACGRCCSTQTLAGSSLTVLVRELTLLAE